MTRSTLAAALLTAFVANAQAPADKPQAEPADPVKRIEARVGALEREIQRLRLQSAEAEAAPPAPAAPPGSVQPNVFNPTMTAFGNAVYRFDDRRVEVEGARVDNQFNLRETELDLRAAVDPFADGVLIATFESPLPGEFEFGVEEGYVTTKQLPLPVLDDPPLGLKLRVGRFRTEMGRVNRLHTHDLPHVQRPLAVEEFLGPEGFIANGASAQMFVPTPGDDESAVELTLQALSGGGAEVAPGAPDAIAFVGNLRWFRTFADAHNFDVAAMLHFGKTDPLGRFRSLTYGVDFLYKWKPLRGGEFRSFVLGGQVLYAERTFLARSEDDPYAGKELKATPFGYFAFAQIQVSRWLYAGVRWDDTDSIDGDRTRRCAASAYLSWYPSEFLRFRLGYERRIGGPDDGRNTALAELNFVFGAHPPEPFWVNR